MLPSTHDFFSEPRWPSLPSDLPSPNRSRSEEASAKSTFKDQVKQSSTNVYPTLEEIENKSILLDLSIQKLLIEEQLQEIENVSLSRLENTPIQPMEEGNEPSLSDIESKSKQDYLFVKFQQLFEESSHTPRLTKTAKNKRTKRLRKHSSTKYNILNKETKQFLVNETSRFPISVVAKMYGVSINNICRWKRSCDRRAGAGRKVTNMRMERLVIHWIQEQNRKGVPLTRKNIQEKAKAESNNRYFKASKGWFERFAKRNQFLNLMAMSDVKQVKMEASNIQVDQVKIEKEWSYDEKDTRSKVRTSRNLRWLE